MASKYELQLEQVNAALANDPQNEDLKKLANDLKDIIELNKRSAKLEASSGSGAAAGGGGGKFCLYFCARISLRYLLIVLEPSKKSLQRDWKVGDTCEAKYHGDGKWYEARIQTMTADKSTFVVLYSGYNETDKLSLKDIRPYTGKLAPVTQSSTSSQQQKKRPVTDDSASAPSAPKKSKGELEHQSKQSNPKKSKGELEHQSKQSNWLNFSAKVSKTGKIPSKSIFSSPDTIDGKVGVTGSGKKMTGK